jgi:alkyl hydroperoxide reductase subunit F
MLDANLKSQLSAYLERIVMPIELVAALDDSESSRELEALLAEIAALSGNISLAREADERTPSFLIRRVGAPDVAVRFAGIPLGHEFTSLVLALLQVGGHPPKVDAALIEQATSLRGEYHFESYYSLSCQNCPDVVQALNLLAVLNPGVRHVAIDGALYRDEVEARDVMAVPAVFLNGRLFAAGRMDLPELLGKLDGDAPTRLATSLAQRAPYDVLIVGGGPAGAAAAIYAARKGIRTGIAGERFGGQLLDTLGIENLVAVEQTEGPALAASLERNVRDYGVEVINQVRAEALLPAVDGGHHQLRLSNGATLLARTLILATGARWRSLDVPGEEQYRNRGVAYCPHCDGPLFKGKRVAVVGGGNSGVEAAIDLAGIVEHVTLLEFAAELRADDVLQQKLASLSNVQVILNAQTTEITGDGQRVNGLVYRDRRDGQSRSITLAGVFVQIGLLPNTEWLRGSLELSKYGEILIDERGVTSVPGVFAAGDATTVPYKQIVVAMGAGSTAALSAFEHLIRHSAPVEPEAKAA